MNKRKLLLTVDCTYKNQWKTTFHQGYASVTQERGIDFGTKVVIRTTVQTPKNQLTYAYPSSSDNSCLVILTNYFDNSVDLDGSSAWQCADPNGGPRVNALRAEDFTQQIGCSVGNLSSMVEIWWHRVLKYWDAHVRSSDGKMRGTSGWSVKVLALCTMTFSFTTRFTRSRSPTSPKHVDWCLLSEFHIQACDNN